MSDPQPHIRSVGDEDAEPDRVVEREHLVATREEVLVTREESAQLREEAAHLREEAAEIREEAARLREETARLREEAVRARDGLNDEAIRTRHAALHAESAFQRLMDQMRDANERLVIATMRAQTLTEEAETANRLKDEFLAAVSHELRTPLNAVLGWARMLSAKQVTESRVPHALETVERNAALLAHIIDDLLDVSRMMVGTLQLASEPVSVVDVVAAAIDVVRTGADERSIAINLSAEAAANERVSGDPIRLQQVLWNLLTNAVKFTPDGGSVDVSIAAAGVDVEIAISDTGEGISESFLPHVFDRFRQADATTTRHHGGLGLGLAIVRQLVELHGGTVRAVSAGLGQGSTFIVRLPRVASRAETVAPSMPSASPHAQQLTGLRVLVVEDNADGRDLMATMLGLVGAHVTTASSVAEALRALDSLQLDVLVSDIGLPGDDGYALIREVRRRDRQRGAVLPAVALTGYTRGEDRARVIEAGFQAHVPKPVEPTVLTSVIAALGFPLRYRSSATTV
jgi:signal transduction histidine kinase/ActR/RegA family two-component response regulator